MLVSKNIFPKSDMFSRTADDEEEDMGPGETVVNVVDAHGLNEV